MPATPVQPQRAFGPATAAVVVAVLLAAAGIGHRLLARQIGTALSQVLPLAQPLASIPMQLGPWRGEDIPIDEQTRQIAGDDDSVNRQYSDSSAQRSVGLYVGYIGRPRTKFSHRPEICYVAHGFERVSQESVAVAMPDGKTVPSVLYEFKSSQLGGPRDVVLAAFVVNGAYATEQEALNGMNARSVQFEGPTGSYVLRMQVSMRASSDRQADIRVLSDFLPRVVEQIKKLLPGQA